MKLLITCSHLVRHIKDFSSDLEEVGISWVALNPDKQQFNIQDMLGLLPGNNIIIAGDDEINEKVIEEASSKGLKAIIKWGIGVDNIDIMAAKKNRISVYNTPNVFGSDVAEQAMSLILNLSRSTHIIDSEVRKGNWCKIEGNSLYDKNLGIIGFGSIGKEIAKRADAFGMKVNFFDPFYKKDSNLNNDFLQVKFEELCKRSDFIVLACSLNKDNQYIVDKKAISMMVKKPYVINISRGPLINEKDLIKALQEKQLRGAGLDVFEKEPLSINSELIKMKNCILGSHNSSNTYEAVKRVNEITIRMVINMKLKATFEIYDEKRIV